MNEQDGHEMLVARAKALKTIAMKYIELHNLDTGTHELSPLRIEQILEKEVEKLEPGCGHRVN